VLTDAQGALRSKKNSWLRDTYTDTRLRNIIEPTNYMKLKKENHPSKQII
jgi:hypothetical protein